ncbi:MAG: DUF2958 domain-containing protein [Armatimonadetes bacterium]|nr:DUF2958 domain-containing protein [Armatimonadota bacterium]
MDPSIGESPPAAPLPIGTRFLYRFSARRTDARTDIQHFHAVITQTDGPYRQWKRIDTLYEENVLRRCETGGFTLAASLDELLRGGYEFDEADLIRLRMPETTRQSPELLAKELADVLPPLYSQEHVDDPVVQARFFTPDSCWSWYPYEYDPTERLFFGWVCGIEREYGFFSLRDLELGGGPSGVRVELDVNFQPTRLSVIRKAVR